MANTKIDSIKLSGSTKTFDIDLPYDVGNRETTSSPSIIYLIIMILSFLLAN